MKRNVLSLEDRVKLIKCSHAKSCRKLAEEFQIGKTQVSDILKRKQEFLEAYEKNVNGNRKRLKLSSDNDFVKIDDAVWQFFVKARSFGAPISGPIIQQMSLKFAESFKVENFKASNGWLQRFKDRHQISSAILCGERGSVIPTTVDDWKNRLPEIISGYSEKDIYNMDETGLFYKALPVRSLLCKDESHAGRKQQKVRLTISLCVNGFGEFEKPLVIGKSEKPRCFKNINIKNLPFIWKWNKKAWMTSLIFTEWLTSFNRRLTFQKRYVLLFVDNAACHTDMQLSNIKLIYFPPNCTSVLQPLDQGIIRNVKCTYRKNMLCSLLSKVETTINIQQFSGIINSMTALDACYWIVQSVQAVKPATVHKCFVNSGFTFDFNSETFKSPENNDHMILSDLLRRTCDHLSNPITVEEYIAIDEEAISVESLEKGWEENLRLEVLSELTKSNPKEMSDHSNDDKSFNQNRQESAVKTYAEAQELLSNLKLFMLEKGHTQIFTHLMNAEQELQHCTVLKQSTLDHFFYK